MFKEKIRIGTMVSCQDKAEYIRQILPHGFESFSLSWWQSLGKTDLKSQAKEVKSALEGGLWKIGAGENVHRSPDFRYGW